MNLEKSIEIIETDSFMSERLKTIYDTVPSGDCKGCLRCCTESVNTFYVEYVHILRFLRNNPHLFSQHVDKISRFFILEMMTPMYCPFVDDSGRCGIYPVRPLPCRVFGHLKEADYDLNYDQVKASNQTLATYFQTNYQLTLPEEVINRKIPYCKDFVSEEKMAIEERDDLVDLLFSLDSKFLMADCIGFEDVNQSLVTWFMKSIMPLEEASDYRIKGMAYYQANRMADLEQLIEGLAERILTVL